MRVLHAEADENLPNVGLVIDENATDITEFQFMQLEAEFDQLATSLSQTPASAAASFSGGKAKSQQYPPTRNGGGPPHNQDAGTTTGIGGLGEVAVEELGRPLERLSITSLIDHTFAGILITRDLMTRAPSQQQQQQQQQQHSSSSSRMPRNNSRSPRQNQQKQDDGGDSSTIDFKEMLYILFPRMPALNIERYFMGHIDEQLLLTLKGSLGVPPYVRFAPSSSSSGSGGASSSSGAGKKRQQQHQQRGRFVGKTAASASSAAAFPGEVTRLVVRGKSFEELTGAMGGLLDLETLAAADFQLGPLLFPETLFIAAAHEGRATFWGCMRILFPRVPEPLLRNYSETTPSVTLLAPVHKLFLALNKSVYRRPPTPPPPEDGDDDDGNKKRGGGKNANQRKGSGRRSHTPVSPNNSFSASALLGSGRAATQKSAGQEQLSKLQQQQKHKNESAAAARDAQSIFLPQLLPPGAKQIVGGEEVSSVADIIAALKERAGGTPRCPVAMQSLKLDDYKEMCFETKKYQTLLPGLPLTHALFHAIQTSSGANGGSGGGQHRPKSARRRSQQPTKGRKAGGGGGGAAISLIATLRFLFPMAPLALFIAFLDSLEKKREDDEQAQQRSMYGGEKHDEESSPQKRQQQQQHKYPIANPNSPSVQNSALTGNLTFSLVGRQQGSVVAAMPSIFKGDNNSGRSEPSSPSSSSPTSTAGVPRFQQRLSREQQKADAKAAEEEKKRQQQHQQQPSIFEVQNAMLLRDPAAIVKQDQAHFTMSIFGSSVSGDAPVLQLSSSQGKVLDFGTPVVVTNTPAQKKKEGAMSSSPSPSPSSRGNLMPGHRQQRRPSPHQTKRSGTQQQQKQQQQRPQHRKSLVSPSSATGITPMLSPIPHHQQQRQQGRSPSASRRSSASPPSRRMSLSSQGSSMRQSGSFKRTASGRDSRQAPAPPQPTQLMRLANGLYTTCNYAQELAAIEAEEREVQAETLRKQKRREQRASAKRSPRSPRSSPVKRKQRTGDEEQKQQEQDEAPSTAAVCDGHNPFGDESFEDDEDEDNTVEETRGGGERRSPTFRDSPAGKSSMRVNSNNNNSSSFRQASAKQRYGPLGALGEMVGAGLHSRYNEYLMEVASELEQNNAPIRKRTRDRASKIQSIEEQIEQEQLRQLQEKGQQSRHQQQQQQRSNSPRKGGAQPQSSRGNNNNNVINRAGARRRSSSPGQRRPSPSARGNNNNSGGGRSSSRKKPNENDPVVALEASLTRLCKTPAEREATVRVNQSHVEKLLGVLDEDDASDALSALRQRAAVLVEEKISKHDAGDEEQAGSNKKKNDGGDSKKRGGVRSGGSGGGGGLVPSPPKSGRR